MNNKNNKFEPWYTEREMHTFFLHNKYCVGIADELTPLFTKYLNSAYRKGLEHGLRNYNPGNVPQNDSSPIESDKIIEILFNAVSNKESYVDTANKILSLKFNPIESKKEDETTILTSAEHKERELLMLLQKSSTRWFTQQEFDRLKELSDKMFKKSNNLTP